MHPFAEPGAAFDGRRPATPLLAPVRAAGADPVRTGRPVPVHSWNARHARSRPNEAHVRAIRSRFAARGVPLVVGASDPAGEAQARERW